MNREPRLRLWWYAPRRALINSEDGPRRRLLTCQNSPTSGIGRTVCSVFSGTPPGDETPNNFHPRLNEGQRPSDRCCCGFPGTHNTAPNLGAVGIALGCVHQPLPHEPQVGASGYGWVPRHTSTPPLRTTVTSISPASLRALDSWVDVQRCLKWSVRLSWVSSIPHSCFCDSDSSGISLVKNVIGLMRLMRTRASPVGNSR